MIRKQPHHQDQILKHWLKKKIYLMAVTYIQTEHFKFINSKVMKIHNIK